MTRQTLTSDLGFLIRDMIEGRTFVHVDRKAGEELDSTDVVTEVDISDANNLVVNTESGAQFIIRIVRTG